MQKMKIAYQEIDAHDEKSADVSATSVSPSLSGYLVLLASLVVTFGTAHGENLTSAADFIPGDELKLRQKYTAAPVSFDNMSETEIKLVFPDAEVGQSVMFMHKLLSLTLMSNFGQVVHAYVLHDQQNNVADSSVLLDDCFDPSVSYTLIEVAK